jgi:hypothetical protein
MPYVAQQVLVSSGCLSRDHSNDSSTCFRGSGMSLGHGSSLFDCIVSLYSQVTAGHFGVIA